jgi:NADH dehydrogenase|tara:strand:- start:1690 stop:2058 length:369 start_codon:yes stop_codon:yes gene_type:complete
MISFFKQIFTWWNRQTFGTFIYTLFTGKLIGADEFGNKYYSNSKGKRWVIYKNITESSSIPPEWHLWIHFLTEKKPPNDIKKFVWQKKHEENLTGTKKAYKPEGSLSSGSIKSIKKYENWKN